MTPRSPTEFLNYVQRLSSASNSEIRNFSEFLSALEQRYDAFAALGCRASDHGLERIWNDGTTAEEAARFFGLVTGGHTLSANELLGFGSFMLVWFGQQAHRRGWVQQYHLGALRNNNRRMLAQLGPDTGWDSIGTFDHAAPLAGLLDQLDRTDQLARTILYNLNPADNEVFATMIGNFQDGSIPGKMQWGSGWWFLDQKDGIERQLNTLSNMGLLSRFVGMLTDSRSFLSFPRHEYFRRILCNLIGADVDKGELPNDVPWLGQMVQNICYRNAKEFFRFPTAKSIATGSR